MNYLRIAVLALLAVSVAAVDREFLRSWEAHQRERPRTVASSSSITPPGEPGTPLRIDGRVLTDDGQAAVRDAIVFAWQTDAEGVYDRPGRGPHSWRLRGWAKTDARGQFRFDTIRPAAYPRGREPAHVHFTVERSDGRRYFASDLLFEDDPLVTARIRNRGSAVIAGVKPEGKTSRVEIVLNLDEDRKF